MHACPPAGCSSSVGQKARTWRRARSTPTMRSRRRSAWSSPSRTASTTTSPSPSRRRGRPACRCRFRPGWRHPRPNRPGRLPGFVALSRYRHGVANPRSQYRCSECRHVTAKWVGRCLECGTWGCVDEVAVLSAVRNGARPALAPFSAAVPISSIEPHGTRHCPTGIDELDRVLGGGVVPGSVTLLAGDPGVGKSTLLLKVAHQWATSGQRALYVSGEESRGQIRMRADRTGCSHDELYLAAESDLQAVLSHIEAVQPTLVVVDSVQTMSSADTDGVAGGVTQVRAVTTALTAAAKTTGVPLILVGHVTKDGAIAGPRSLEHLVDVVLHFEGDRNSLLRMVRGVKNRFGAADEVGCFLLQDNGIEGVVDPSGLFLDQRPQPVAGTAITVTLDGKRPLIGEVQALLATPSNSSPRRAVSGIDHARAAMRSE